RIYATFVVSVLLFALVAAAMVWCSFSSWDETRVGEAVDLVDGRSPELAAALQIDDRPAVSAILGELGAELHAELILYPRERGRRLGPPIVADNVDLARGDIPPPPLNRKDINRLSNGRSIVHRRGLTPPQIGVPLFKPAPDSPSPGTEGGDDDDQTRDLDPKRLIAVVSIVPSHNPRRGLAMGAVLLLLVLAGGAWPLARSLSSRLDALERSTRVLASGELSHRAAVVSEPRDEVDALAIAFNQMAERLETVLTGQRTLLANVSHELRTPISRIKVLVEILGERLETMRTDHDAGEPFDPAGLARLERGLGEMHEDLAEVEALIQDLLTSGRLELAADGALQRETIDLQELCDRAAGRFDAAVHCEDPPTVVGDRLLLERLLRNLLANARRACPSGVVSIRAFADPEGGRAVIEVEDEGKGIPVEKRQEIFEPFARLDSARTRDKGGVGLGLYLCRQIAKAHGGSITAEGRRDGRPGARFIIRL
ncbi:MAG: HAMP domain-containing histidine kinase, partial [Myxococcales bacterium]|nr:HAMP domain-containing histidine kinase [Myxococcales bacterium]